MQKLNQSRKEMFGSLDRPVLKPLPTMPYQYASWKKATVPINYHVQVEGHYYSVPYHLVGRKLDVRITTRTVEIFLKGKGIVSTAKLQMRRLHHAFRAPSQIP